MKDTGLSELMPVPKCVNRQRWWSGVQLPLSQRRATSLVRCLRDAHIS